MDRLARPDWATIAIVTCATAVFVRFWAQFMVGSFNPLVELLFVAWVPVAMQTQAWSTFVGFLSRTEPATGIALFRAALAITTLGILLQMTFRGTVDVMWVDVGDGGYRAVKSSSWILAALGGPTRAGVHRLVAVLMVSLTCLAMGLGTRFMAAIAAITFRITTDLNGHAGGSYDELIKNGLWILVLSPCTATLSLDCRIRTGSWTSDVPVAAFGRYLAIGQLVLMYWTTGLQKLSNHWMPSSGFDALYYILMQWSWARFDLRPYLGWVYPLTQLGTAVAWFWENTNILWLLAFWYRATRTRPGLVRAYFNAWDVRSIYAIIGVIFHVGLWVIMDVGPFSPASLAYYFCLYHPDEYRALVRRLRTRLKL